MSLHIIKLLHRQAARLIKACMNRSDRVRGKQTDGQFWQRDKKLTNLTTALVWHSYNFRSVTNKTKQNRDHSVNSVVSIWLCLTTKNLLNFNLKNTYNTAAFIQLSFLMFSVIVSQSLILNKLFWLDLVSI